MSVVMLRLSAPSLFDSGPARSASGAGVALAALLIALSIGGLLRSRRAVSRQHDEDSLGGVAEWFLQMRWLACGTAAALVASTIHYWRLLDGSLQFPLLTCLAILAGANVVFTRALHSETRSTRKLMGIQVVTDLVVLTAMLHLSGGLENPLSLLYLFHVIIAGILFDRVACYLVALLSVSLFAVLAVAELAHWVPHYTLHVFPHASGVGEHSHASHDARFVLSRILLLGVLLLTTAYFITTIMMGLREREARARRHARKETEARERLESVVEAAGAGLRLLDDRLQPLWTNARFEEWAAHRDELLEAASSTLSDGRPRRSEHRVGDDALGQQRHYATMTAAMTREDGTPHSIVQFVQDVSDQHDAEAQARHSEKLAAIGELAGNVAHEINNPLGILSARLHLLDRRRPEAAGLGVHQLIKLTDRMSAVTHSLLGFCRRDSSEHRLVTLTPAIEHAAELTGARARSRGVKVDYEIGPEAPTLRGNPRELEQVAVNLILNAIDASPDGGRVSVRVAVSETELTLVVEDEGPGVPPELRERVFDPFFSTKPAGEGTGLGLSVSRRIANDHGGSISVQESPLQGARFALRLPCTPARS